MRVFNFNSHLGVIFEVRGWGEMGCLWALDCPSQLPVATSMHSYVYTCLYMYQSAKQKGKECVHVKIIELIDKLHQHKYIVWGREMHSR